MTAAQLETLERIPPDELLRARLVRARFEALAEWGITLADARAIAAELLAAERVLGFAPCDVSRDNCGYDIESRHPDGTGHLRFVEVTRILALAGAVLPPCGT